MRIGDKVVKNPAMWIGSEFDRWGAGVGIGEVVDVGSDYVDVRWPTGRCYQKATELTLYKGETP